MKTNKQVKQYEFAILRPGGNDTMLIKGIVKESLRKPLNDIAMKFYPNIEQVGFYSYSPIKKLGRLEMAGGEFCGNALRSLAYLLLKGKKGEIRFKVSGVNRLLKAGVSRKNIAYTQMPIMDGVSSVARLGNNLWQVDLEGISHLITVSSKKLGPKKAKIIAKGLLKRTGLLESKPASGVMFIRQSKFNSETDSEPVVWVRDIQTFFYETACASGTAAIGLWSSLQDKNQNTTLQVKQPSGSFIKVKVQKAKAQFTDVFIEGSIKILKQRGKLSI